MELALNSLLDRLRCAARELWGHPGSQKPACLGDFLSVFFFLCWFCFVLFCFFQKAKKALATLPWERGENNRPAAPAQSRRGENVLRQLVKGCAPEAPSTRNRGTWLSGSHSQPPRRPQLACLVSLCPCWPACLGLAFSSSPIGDLVCKW